MASAGGKLMSAEERRRAKELEEARKAGLAAPEVSICDLFCVFVLYTCRQGGRDRRKRQRGGKSESVHGGIMRRCIWV